MRWIPFFVLVLFCAPFVFAIEAPPGQIPAPKAITPGQNQMILCKSLSGCGDFQKDLNVTFYTPELSIFNDATCSDGPCRNNIPGTAHRSWPINACVAICNLQNNVCSKAIIMDRGPNERLVRRTIDANPALRTALKMSGGLTPATYKLISLPQGGKSVGDCAGAIDSASMKTSGVDYNAPAQSGYSPTGNPIGTAYQANQPAQSAYPTAIAPQQAQAVGQPGQYFSPTSVASPANFAPLPGLSLTPSASASSSADKLLSLLGVKSATHDIGFEAVEIGTTTASVSQQLSKVEYSIVPSETPGVTFVTDLKELAGKSTETFGEAKSGQVPGLGTPSSDDPIIALLVVIRDALAGVLSGLKLFLGVQ